uniref:Uncharacterized protein n=1 Tax=viral metagenome TaxID=1070528 RepID=A0A6C0B4B1_9ZZZZ
MTHKISILYRPNNFYTDLADFINTYNLENYDLDIYNCTDEDINQQNVIKTDEKIAILIKSIYHDNNGYNCTILDTCIKYNDFDIVEILKHSKNYCLLHFQKFEIPIILTKLVEINNIDILIDYDTEYDDYIICNGVTDNLFYKNFFNKLNTTNLIFASCLNEDISNLDDFRLDGEKSKQYFKIFKLWNSDTNDFPDAAMINIFENTGNDIHLICVLIEEFLKNTPASKRIVEPLINNFEKYNSITPFIVYKKFEIYTIYEYIIGYFLNEPLFMISDIPKWVLTGHNTDIVKYYPCITTEQEVLTLPLLFEKDILLESYNTININTDKINISNKAALYRSGQILTVNSITPLGYSLYDSYKTIISYIYHLNYKNYIIKGLFINFNNYLLGLMQEDNKSYKIIVLNYKNLKLESLSNNFILDRDMEAISLYKNNNELFVLSRNNNNKIFQCKIDLDTLIVHVLHSKNILKSSPFSFNIELKNSIGVKIVDFDLTSKSVYKSFTFYNLPTDHKYFINVLFNPKQKLLEIDDKILYINKFIFLDNKLDNNVEKVADIYFHKSSKNTEIYEKCIELQISLSNNYKECKYFIIQQDEFEKMDCLEISNIIKNRCLIVSLIDETLLKNDKLSTKYTTNESLIKLFLINIVKNKTHVQFIFDKLIHANEYFKRREFMSIDIENIESENNIYDCILGSINKEDNINIKLNDKDASILQLIKSKILKTITPDIYKNILDITKYIIQNNYAIKIAFMDIDSNFIEENNYNNLLHILFKINWLGKIDFNVDINSEEKYNLYILKSKDDMNDVSFRPKSLLYLIKENLLFEI